MYSSKVNNDRFVPHRFNIPLNLTPNELLPELDITDPNRDTGFINYAKIRYNQTNYINALKSVLLPYEPRVLNFFPPKKFQPNKPKISETWPVKPRKKPVIGPPEMILDMPNFDSNICHHVCDWSSQNYLATIFESEVHMWCPHSDFLRATTSTGKRVQNCVKWKNTGTEFAVGLFPNRLGIWDILARKITFETFCCFPACEVRCFDWLNNTLITGCDKGVLKMYNSSLKLLMEVPNAHNGAIINIVSNKKYVATSGVDKNVIVWKLPALEGHFRILLTTVVRALAWHPWKSFLLAIGHVVLEGHVMIMNVNTRKSIAKEKFAFKNSTVDCLSFNPISGELVASYYVRHDRDSNVGNGIITVFSDILTIVEELHIHDGPIPYLLWGNGGKVLASASADENLCIWNFFGVSPTRENNVKKENKNSNSVLLRTFIR